MYKRYTHCEFHPLMMLGNISSNIVFTEHNQSPRNYYNFSQVRQAMGIYATNYRHRSDISYILLHPQLPLVTSRAAKYTGAINLPAGENSIVAIASYTGYNQEDSIIMNKSSIDRGLYRSISLKKYEDISKKSSQTTNEDEFGAKDRSLIKGMNEKERNYDKVNDKGFAPEETKLISGDVIIQKTSAITDGDGKLYRDESQAYKSNIDGYVDKVWSKIYDGDGYQMIKMRIRSERTPMVGDKFCMDDSHDILTINGWKNIKDLTMNDMVATLQDGNELKYCFPLEIQKLEHNGDMCLIETNDVNLCVTPYHRMYVSDDAINYKFELAENIFDKPKYYLKNANIKYLNINEINELNNNTNFN